MSLVSELVTDEATYDRAVPLFSEGQLKTLEVNEVKERQMLRLSFFPFYSVFLSSEIRDWNGRCSTRGNWSIQLIVKRILTRSKTIKCVWTSGSTYGRQLICSTRRPDSHNSRHISLCQDSFDNNFQSGHWSGRIILMFGLLQIPSVESLLDAAKALFRWYFKVKSG